MLEDKIKIGFTFDDVLILPAKSNVLPAQADVTTKLTQNISLNIPIISSAMDTVTESKMAIALAQQGGLGIIHRNMTIEAQAEEVDKVKRYESGMIVDPITMRPHYKIFEAKEVMKKYGISGLPITDENNILIGILTNRDIRFETRLNISLEKVMTKKLVTVPLATSLEEAELLLLDLGVNAVKVGVGPGSICTTRVVSGAGIPQITAIAKVFKVTKSRNIPLIADGGIKFSGDITKAIVAGASVVMIGNQLAGTDESPGEVVIYQGRSYKTYRGMGSIEVMRQGKSSDRYFQDPVSGESKLVPEGIEGRVPYKGSVSKIIHMMVGGLKSGMGYSGCRTIAELKRKARFIRITPSGMRESHVHDVIITKEAPNYHLD